VVKCRQNSRVEESGQRNGRLALHQKEDETVAPSPDEILGRELAKLASKAGKAEAGAGVVRWVARKMPTDAFHVALHFPEDGNRVAVNVTGLAKEGLIKQHAGEKAARRIAGRLQAVFLQAADLRDD
jgi:hypothetical protein